MKKLLKAVIVFILNRQVRKLYKKHQFITIAVAGSIGKTSTKLAIARMLSAKFRVQFQDGNYNDVASVPLIYFGQEMPSLYNPLAWMKVFWVNHKILKSGDYNFDVVVIELGIDGPKQMQQFGKAIKVDLGVLTAISPEHMANFKDLDEVAFEELHLVKLAEKTLVNLDLIDVKFLKNLERHIVSYAVDQSAVYQLKSGKKSTKNWTFYYSGLELVNLSKMELIRPSDYSLAAAMAVGHIQGMSPEDIKESVGRIKPIPGRNNILNGINNSVIIDDTYNASPSSVETALKSFYNRPAVHKIAILGSMNELGKFSEQLHREIGRLCDPKQLELLVTIGQEANKFIASEAELQGCRVLSFNNPIEAGLEIKSLVPNDCLILAKGSQNGVFAEECIKILLAKAPDKDQLVRQSPAWLKTKAKALGLH